MVELSNARDLSGFAQPPHPAGLVLEGRYALLEPLNADRHAMDLHRAFSADESVWEYMSYGPFAGATAYRRWVKENEASHDPVYVAIRTVATGHYAGVASFLRIDRVNGVIEIGHICLSAEMQKTRAATEALFLLMQWAFSAGYRRIEWKCNARNTGSRRAAQRLGFSYEGIFRQHMIVKGLNRDTAWFSVIDSEWPGLLEAFSAWLAPSNFSDEGRQRERLSDLTQLVRAADDPGL